MLSKEKLRKRYSKIRKFGYFEINSSFFKPFFKLINPLTKSKKKTIYISFYYPSNYEVNILKLLEKIKKKKKIISLLPYLNKKNEMNFTKWQYLDNLKVNKYGMLEPSLNLKPNVPDVMLIPLLAFDTKNNRLGYGKGYYDNFLNKYLKKNKNILTIGVAFSFQRYDKLPISKYDVSLNYILTEKAMIKK